MIGVSKMSEKIIIISKAQYEEYMELKKQAKTTQIKRWEPKYGDCVWCINALGDLKEITYVGCLDEVALKIGNCFQTREEAQKELDRRFAEQELLDMCDGDGNIEIRYRPNSGEFETSGSDCLFGKERFFIWSPYRFSTNESCQEAIDTLGTEKLKLIFRVD
jgi:hypothetical protein